MGIRDALATGKLLMELRGIWKNWQKKITPDMVVKTFELIRDFLIGRKR